MLRRIQFIFVRDRFDRCRRKRFRVWSSVTIVFWNSRFPSTFELRTIIKTKLLQFVFLFRRDECNLKKMNRTSETVAHFCPDRTIFININRKTVREMPWYLWFVSNYELHKKKKKKASLRIFDVFYCTILTIRVQRNIFFLLSIQKMIQSFRIMYNKHKWIE